MQICSISNVFIGKEKSFQLVSLTRFFHLQVREVQVRQSVAEQRGESTPLEKYPGIPSQYFYTVLLPSAFL